MQEDFLINGYIGYCPECGELIEDSIKHCLECGQALDWSGDNSC